MGFWLSQFLAGLTSAAILFLVSVGLSLVFGITRIVNFAHGAFLMIGAYVGYALVERYGDGRLAFWLCVVAAALITGLFGAIIEIVLLRRLYRAPELFQLLATFAVALIAEDALLAVFGSEDLLGPRAPGLEGSIRLLGAPFPLYDLVNIAIAPVVLAGLWLVMRRTRWGVLVRAAAQDRDMVGALGVDQAWLFTGVFFLGSFLAGLAGALQIPREAINLAMGSNAIAEAFAVVVIGGMGSLPGAFLAALLIGELHAFGVALYPQLTLVLTFLIMAVTLVIRPCGLFGRPQPIATPHEFSGEPPLRAAGRPAAIGFAVALLVLLAAPAVLGGYAVTVLTEILIYIVFAVSLYFIMGPGGLISFGHACYFGLGAYAVALLVQHAKLATLPALAAAMLVGGASALAFGWLCMRVSGVYFAMLTLALAQIVWSVAFQWYGVTGGDNGIVGIWPTGFAASRVAFYYLVLALGVSAVLGLHHLVHSPFGYTLRASRDSALRAGSIGIEVAFARWLAFGLAGAVAALAGGMFAFAKGSVFPGSVHVTRSIDVLVMVLLGGVHGILGPVIGAAAFLGLQSEIIRHTDLWRAILGAAIIALVLLLPDGLTGAAQRLARRAGAR